MKKERLQRILEMVSLLQSSQPLTADDLAAQFNVHRRTIFRDIKMLGDAGFTLVFDDKTGGYRADESAFLPPLHLRLSEALALLMTVQGAGHAGMLPLMGEAYAGALKLEAVLPRSVQDFCGSLLQRCSVKLAAQSMHHHASSLFRRLQRAVREKRKMNIEYDSFFEKKLIRTVLSPYHLFFGQRAWYVIGHSSMHREIRTFKVSRIRNLEMRNQLYVLDKPFDIAEYFGDAWSMIPEGRTYQVCLVFESRVAANVAEVSWHPRQRLNWLDDGRLQFDVRVDGLGEISWWIMGYGDQVRVINPKPLQDRIHKMAQNICKLYNDGDRTCANA